MEIAKKKQVKVHIPGELVLKRQIQRAWKEAEGLRKKWASTVFTLGELLTKLKAVAKVQSWKRYCDETLKIPHATARQAMALYKAAMADGKDASDLATMPVMDAKVKFGVLKAKKSKPAGPGTKSKPSPALPGYLPSDAPPAVIKFAMAIQEVEATFGEATRHFEDIERRVVAMMAEKLGDIASQITDVVEEEKTRHGRQRKTLAGRMG